MWGGCLCPSTLLLHCFTSLPKERSRNMREEGRMEWRLTPQTPIANFWPCLETFLVVTTEEAVMLTLSGGGDIEEALKSEGRLATHKEWGGNIWNRGLRAKWVCAGGDKLPEVKLQDNCDVRRNKQYNLLLDPSRSSTIPFDLLHFPPNCVFFFL